MTFATNTAITARDEWTPPTKRAPPDIHLDALLERDATAAALTASGYRTSPATLATKAVRGGGPPFRRYGRKPIYRWGDALEWARSRLSRRVNSTSELDRSAALP
jgi:hypothetical protein